MCAAVLGHSASLETFPNLGCYRRLQFGAVIGQGRKLTILDLEVIFGDIDREYPNNPNKRNDS